MTNVFRLIRVSISSRPFWICYLLFFGILIRNPQAEVLDQFLQYDEYRALVNELAPKVDLFKDIWAQDAKARFYGGSVRDFSIWVLGQFRGCVSRKEVMIKMRELRGIGVIPIRDFVSRWSDVDVLSSKTFTGDAATYGIEKVEYVSPARLDPNSAEGASELNEGFIPVERMLLSKEGVHSPVQMGDGLREIFEGKVSAVFTDEQRFRSSHFARMGLNDQVLLGLRYLRNVTAVAYAHIGSYSGKALNVDKFMNPESAHKADLAIQRALTPGALNKFFENNSFKKWLNGVIRKTWTGFAVNSAVSHRLYRDFRVFDLIRKYQDKIDQGISLHFVRQFDPSEIRKNLQSYGINEEDLFTPVKKLFPDDIFYHATRSDSALRSIFEQGPFDSDKHCSAGRGLYGVNNKSRQFAVNWAHGHENLVIPFYVNPNARVIDLTQDPGKKLFEQFLKKSDPFEKNADVYEEFANSFGADILRYDYSAEYAFVAKNSLVLSINKPAVEMENAIRVANSNWAKRIKQRKFESHGFEDDLKWIFREGLNADGNIEDFKAGIEELIPSIETRMKELEPYQAQRVWSDLHLPVDRDDERAIEFSRFFYAKIFDVMDKARPEVTKSIRANWIKRLTDPGRDAWGNGHIYESIMRSGTQDTDVLRAAIEGYIKDCSLEGLFLIKKARIKSTKLLNEVSKLNAQPNLSHLGLDYILENADIPDGKVAANLARVILKEGVSPIQKRDLLEKLVKFGFTHNLTFLSALEVAMHADPLVSSAAAPLIASIRTSNARVLYALLMASRDSRLEKDARFALMSSFFEMDMNPHYKEVLGDFLYQRISSKQAAEKLGLKVGATQGCLIPMLRSLSVE